MCLGVAKNEKIKTPFDETKTCPHCGVKRSPLQVYCPKCDEFVWDDDDNKQFKNLLKQLFDYLDYIDRNQNPNLKIVNEWKKYSIIKLNYLYWGEVYKISSTVK